MPDRRKHLEMLNRTCAMWDDPRVKFYQDLDFVPEDEVSLFALGPSSRHDVIEFKWRADLHHLVRVAGYDGYIYMPEPREDDWTFKRTFPMKISTWERQRILRSTLVFGWVPREPIQLPGRMTNFEAGALTGMVLAQPEKFKDRFMIGAPPDAHKVDSEMDWIRDAGITPFDNLDEMCAEVPRRVKKLIELRKHAQESEGKA
jgi:hypothetical protein